MLAVQHGGLAYVSNTTLGGTFALRACILNHRTTDADMPRLLAIIEEAAERRVRHVGESAVLHGEP